MYSKHKIWVSQHKTFSVRLLSYLFFLSANNIISVLTHLQSKIDNLSAVSFSQTLKKPRNIYALFFKLFHTLMIYLLLILATFGWLSFLRAHSSTSTSRAGILTKNKGNQRQTSKYSSMSTERPGNISHFLTYSSKNNCGNYNANIATWNQRLHTRASSLITFCTLWLCINFCADKPHSVHPSFTKECFRRFEELAETRN